MIIYIYIFKVDIDWALGSIFQLIIENNNDNSQDVNPDNIIYVPG